MSAFYISLAFVNWNDVQHILLSELKIGDDFGILAIEFYTELSFYISLMGLLNTDISIYLTWEQS